MADDLTIRERVLEAIPHRPPFRFIDEILAIDGETIVSAYRFKKQEYFYQGHFPGNPLTPGVILIETMAQAGVAALGIYLLLKDRPAGDTVCDITPIFVFADKVEFSGMVKPEERVIITGEKIYFRRGNIKTRVGILREDNTLVCQGVLTGTGMRLS